MFHISIIWRARSECVVYNNFILLPFTGGRRKSAKPGVVIIFFAFYYVTHTQIVGVRAKEIIKKSLRFDVCLLRYLKKYKCKLVAGCEYMSGDKETIREMC